ncbi:MAG TPA: sigma-70 family RNA polymerase sigma factor [Terriglobia bacterium]|nr:sigma-70 family RNA polymerase sigma factor [Terriglobia bacterium]
MGKPIDRNEVRQLYERQSRGLLAYACSFTASFAAAEDALHQVFERLLRGDIEITGSAESYLYRAIRNTSLNQIRGRSRETELDDDISSRWFDSPPGLEQTALELQSSLRDLPEEQREVVLMHIWGGMTFEEISVALGTSPNTAASRYRYGLSKLREQFQSPAPPVGVRRAYGRRFQ